MDNSNVLLDIFGRLIDFIQGPTGKALCILMIIGAGIATWHHMVSKKTFLGIIVGTVLVFGASWLGQNILNISR